MSGQVNFGGTSSTASYTDGFVYSNGVSVATGRTCANGQTPIRITELYGYVSGRGASRTITMALGAASATLTVASASAATATGWKAVSAYYNGGSLQFRYTGSGSFYFARGATGTGLATNSSGFEWTGTLGGSYKYVEAPVAPASLVVTPSGVGGFSVSWNAPTDNGGSAITGYRLEYSTSSAFTGATAVTVAGTSHTVTGLTPGVMYYFRVAARNAVTDNYSTWSVYSSTRSATALGGIEVWNGTAWEEAESVEVWNGTAWVPVSSVEIWGGASWTNPA